MSRGCEQKIWDRLREERLRLRLDLTGAARIAGASVSGYRRWEVDRAVPGDALAQLATAGFDVQYIVTGVRLPDRVQDVVATYGAPGEDRAARALRLVMDVAEELGILQQLSAEQLQLLVGYAHQWAPTRDSLRAFVETAMAVGLGTARGE